MRTSCTLTAALLFLLALTTPDVLAAARVGVVVRDTSDPEWVGALVLRDILQRPTIIGLLPEGTEVDLMPHLSNLTYHYVAADGIRGWVRRELIRELDGVPHRRQRAAVGRPLVFADIPADHWARQAVERMVKAGLIERHGDRFQGNKPVTRYELAVVLDRAQKRVEQSQESIEARLRSLEEGSGRQVCVGGHHHHDSGSACPSATGSSYRFLLSLSQTLRSLQTQSEELKGRLDALDPNGGVEVARRLRTLEHRLDTIERTLGNG